MPHVHAKHQSVKAADSGEVKEPVDIAIEKVRMLCDELDTIDKVIREEIENEKEEEKDSENEEEASYRYDLSSEEAKRRIGGMRNYLHSIANTPFSDALPPPHLERHQAYLLFGGYLHSFKKLETILLGVKCFPFPVIDAVIQSIHDLFKRKPVKRPPGAKIEFVSLIPATTIYDDYDLPKHIPSPYFYVSHVLVHEVITKLVMDLEGCDHPTATGIALGLDKPTRTPYGQTWERLVDEVQKRTQANKARKRKQNQPKRVIKKR